MEVENFFGCYLLFSLNLRYKGRTYIGFTVDPNRRIKQHNRGLKAGGAWRTNNKGPWEMILIVHGFPNEISALRFEWAWQHPDKSRRLHHVTKKENRESHLEYRFRILSEMLCVGPWNRLPLTVRWLKESYQIDFKPHSLPPSHIPICQGPVKCCKLQKDSKQEEDSSDVQESCDSNLQKMCPVCCKIIAKKDALSCFHPDCNETFHLLCLAEQFLKSQQTVKLIPIEGTCLRCNRSLLWGDVIQYSRGCYRKLITLGGEGDQSKHWSSELGQDV